MRSGSGFDSSSPKSRITINVSLYWWNWRRHLRCCVTTATDERSLRRLVRCRNICRSTQYTENWASVIETKEYEGIFLEKNTDTELSTLRNDDIRARLRIGYAPLNWILNLEELVIPCSQVRNLWYLKIPILKIYLSYRHTPPIAVHQTMFGEIGAETDCCPMATPNVIRHANRGMTHCIRTEFGWACHCCRIDARQSCQEIPRWHTHDIGKK